MSRSISIGCSADETASLTQAFYPMGGSAWRKKPRPNTPRDTTFQKNTRGEKTR